MFKPLSLISVALLGKPVGQVRLIVNNGGLVNRGAPQWAKEMFKNEVLPKYLRWSDDSPQMVTGSMVCDVADGFVRSMVFKNWYLQKRRQKYLTGA